MTYEAETAHMFRRILVAIDGSTQAQQALADAVDLALAHNACLTVMTVVPRPAVVVLGYTEPIYVEDPWDKIERECGTLLDRSVDSLPDGVSVTKILKHGAPARAIVHEAVAEHHDLIVMGSRGRSELRSVVFGSVSHDVIQRSPVPVLVSPA